MLYEVKQFSRSLDGTFSSETIGEYPDHEDASIAAMTAADQLDNNTDTPFTRHGDIWLIRDDGELVAYVQIFAPDDSNWVTIPEAASAWRNQYSEAAILEAVRSQRLPHKFDDNGQYLVRRPDIKVMLA